jgi:hypothetical protein
MRTIDSRDEEDMIDAAAQELCYLINFLDFEEAKDMAARIFEIWDRSYGAFEVYEEGDIDSFAVVMEDR